MHGNNSILRYQGVEGIGGGGGGTGGGGDWECSNYFKSYTCLYVAFGAIQMVDIAT